MADAFFRRRILAPEGKPAPTCNFPDRGNVAINEQPLEKALREAAEWKARALAAQGAAEAMRVKAQALKDSAQQALQGTRDLQASLQRARGEILALQAQLKELNSQNSLLAQELAVSTGESEKARASLSSVQQQLALYMAALEETRQGSDLEAIRSVLAAVLANPTVEDELRAQLEQVRAENHGLTLAFERSQSELANLESELRARDETLEDKEREYFALYGELDLTKSILQEMRQAAGTTERLQTDLKRALERLRKKELALAALEAEKAQWLEQSQAANEALSRQIEGLESENLELRGRLEGQAEAESQADLVQSLQAMVVQLEDQISDLEIVNSDLYQRLSLLEND